MLTFDMEKCDNCFICAAVCPNGIIGVENGLPRIRPERELMCIHCGHCEAHCPQDAICVDYPDARPYAGASLVPAITSQQIGCYLASRRSVRKFKKTPVDMNSIEELMEMVRFAPTTGNVQDVHWIIISGREKINKFVDIAVQWMKAVLAGNPEHPESRYLSVFVSEWENGRDRICWEAPHLAIAHGPILGSLGPINGVIAASYLEIAAPTFGIGTCWAGIFQMIVQSSEELKKGLGIPEGHSVTGALMFGYPEYKIQRIPRRLPAKWL